MVKIGDTIQFTDRHKETVSGQIFHIDKYNYHVDVLGDRETVYKLAPSIRVIQPNGRKTYTPAAQRVMDGQILSEAIIGWLVLISVIGIILWFIFSAI